MKIAVLGAGAVGSTLARHWLQAGEDVVVGVRDLSSERAASLARDLHVERLQMLRPAAGSAEVVVLAVPGAAVPEVVGALTGALDGKLVIDATNNIAAPVRNSVGVVTAAAPTAVVFRAFNSLPAPTLADPAVGDRPPDMFFCGPDSDQRRIVERLIVEVGLNPVHVGGLEWVAVVDALGGLSFALGQTRPGVRLALNLVTA